MLGSAVLTFFKSSNPGILNPVFPAVKNSLFPVISRAFSTNVFDFGIIGGGVAGMSAAMQAGLLGYSVSLFDKRDSYGKDALSTLGGNCYPKTEIQSITKEKNHFVLHDAQKLQYLVQKVILAVGVTFDKLEVPGAEALDGKGVYNEFDPYKTYEGIEELTPVLVYGAGNTAGHAALHFHSIGARVTLVYNQQNITNTMSKLLMRGVVNSKLERIPNSVITNISGNKSISSVDLREVPRKLDKRVLTKALFVLNEPRANHIPYMNFDNIECDTLGYVCVRGIMCSRFSFATSIPNIYAIGDIVAIEGGKPVLAYPQGIAVIEEAGRNHEFK